MRNEQVITLNFIPPRPANPDAGWCLNPPIIHLSPIRLSAHTHTNTRKHTGQSYTSLYGSSGEG